jgi:amidase
MSADGGGSTRVPAAFCGLVGLKATRGRVPQPLTRSEYSSRIYIEGVVTRSVRDTAAAYETLTRVPNGGSFMPLPTPTESYLAALQRPPRRLRVGLTTGSWGRPGATEAEIAARTREVGRLLGGLGHEVEEIDDTTLCDWPVLWDAYLVNWLAGQARLPATAQARGIAAAELRRHVEPMTFRHYLAADRYDKLDLFRMMDGNRVVTRSFGRAMERCDVLLAPALPIRVPPANGPYSLLRDEEIDPWIGRLMDACRYTMPANETGLPAIALPAGRGSDGLPIGVQFYGNFCAEHLLLQLAAQVEAARPEWFGAAPPIHVARTMTPH